MTEKLSHFPVHTPSAAGESPSITYNSTTDAPTSSVSSHQDRSNQWGPWTRAPTTFSNEYFRLLLEEKWTLKTTHNGQAWNGGVQYEDKSGELMMLPTDLALVQDPKMKPIVQEYAKDETKFFEDFAKAWIKLQELGVRSPLSPV